MGPLRLPVEQGGEAPNAVPLVLDADQSSDDESALPMDFQIASAAFLLHQYGYQFDWEQLTHRQQDIYHGMVGRLRRSIEDVDLTSFGLRSVLRVLGASAPIFHFRMFSCW